MKESRNDTEALVSSYLAVCEILLNTLPTKVSLIMSLSTILFKYFLMLLFKVLLSFSTSAWQRCLLRMFLRKRKIMRKMCSITKMMLTN